jgi:hypothetical protein
LFVNGKEVPDFFIMNKNTIKFQLPDQNNTSLKIKIERNGLVSNELTIKAIIVPYISKVNTVSENTKNYFRLL